MTTDIRSDVAVNTHAPSTADRPTSSAPSNTHVGLRFVGLATDETGSIDVSVR